MITTSRRRSQVARLESSLNTGRHDRLRHQSAYTGRERQTETSSIECSQCLQGNDVPVTVAPFAEAHRPGHPETRGARVCTDTKWREAVPVE